MGVGKSMMQCGWEGSTYTNTDTHTQGDDPLVVPSTFYVRGVSYHREEMRQLFVALRDHPEETKVWLQLVDDNPHDPNAVEVGQEISQPSDYDLGVVLNRVGWVPREITRPLRMMMQGLVQTSSVVISGITAEVADIDISGVCPILALTVMLPGFLPRQASKMVSGCDNTEDDE